MVDLIFKEKPYSTLVSLADDSKAWYASALCKETDTTFPHMLKILKEFESVGLIRTHTVGRIKRIKLTEQGSRIAKLVQETYVLLNEQKSVGDSNNVLEKGGSE